jgi:hypothetical protein
MNFLQITLFVNPIFDMFVLHPYRFEINISNIGFIQSEKVQYAMTIKRKVHFKYSTFKVLF